MNKTRIRDFASRYGRWFRLSESPLGKTLTLQLIKEERIFAVKAGSGKRGVWLIDADSFDHYLQSLAANKPAKQEAGV